ncbi:hypothetical protein J4G07_21525 [Candidatus Poribacteria bacterium]|nr:hypothetical protein [Candidatus Poribacteria bacterium]
MIQNNQELKATLDRVNRFEKQVEKLRQVETNPRNYELSAGGFLAEIDRMVLEVEEYLLIHSSELVKMTAGVDHIKTDGVLFNLSMWREWGLSPQETH